MLTSTVNLRTRRPPSSKIRARDTLGDGTANGSAGVNSAPIHKPMTLQKAKSIARHLGLTLRVVCSGDYRVNFRDGNETRAYYTDNLEDAVNTATEMARKRAFSSDWIVLAATNKCLAQSNKSPHEGKATKKREIRRVHRQQKAGTTARTISANPRALHDGCDEIT
jgi:hypothetical protein